MPYTDKCSINAQWFDYPPWVLVLKSIIYGIGLNDSLSTLLSQICVLITNDKFICALNVNSMNFSTCPVLAEEKAWDRE